jgi:hypothetical protein
MPLQFLLDENIPGSIRTAIDRHNDVGQDFLDVIRVGETDDLPLGSTDRSILIWCEQQDRLLITKDTSTIPAHFAEHLAAGRSCPGIFMLAKGISITLLVEYLILVAYASESMEWRDRIEYITSLT